IRERGVKGARAGSEERHWNDRGRAMPARGNRFACDGRFFGNAERIGLDRSLRKTTHTLSSTGLQCSAGERRAFDSAEATVEPPLSPCIWQRRDWVGVANKTRNLVDWFGPLPTDLPPMTFTYLDSLNREQRRAVEHGFRKNNAAPEAALLVIAGAGSGKTSTVAHRVAHLIVNGADRRRILLMTFSRRAAAEMTRRVERIARQVMGSSAGVMTEALTWAGTFHGIGARLLREYAGQIGIDPAFTIHDREDSADLMNLVRHELGFSKT